MNILIVWYEDDNFGDNLIKICFEQLLKVVLKNLNINLDEYNINCMALKKIDYELLHQSDIIFFAGGGLFGLSYLNFFDYLDEITRVAEEWKIPVVFSSMGINNMDATPETEGKLRNILERRSIVAVSVRENLELFKEYAQNCTFDIELVADPATWTKYVYASQIEKIKKERVVGINVVRGGLFKDNKKDWGLNREIDYLNELKSLLDNASLKYRFFTNGSFLDNNALKYYARKNNIPTEQIILPDCTQDLVKTVASFDFVVGIRMHSSIISYAMETPCVNLIWNDKIPLFYQNIDMPDRAIKLENWNANNIFGIISGENNFKINHDYLMSLYTYIYNTVSKIRKIDRKEHKIYNFYEVCEELNKISHLIDNDNFDLRLKIQKGQNHYLARFIDLLKNEEELTTNKKMIAKLNKENESKAKEIESKTKELKKYKKIAEQKTKELDRLNNKIIIKILKKINRTLKKVKKFFSKKD